MMESALKTINSVKSANCHINKFLSASGWPLVVENFCRKLCQMTSLLVWYASHLQEKQLPSALNKIPNLHMHISISEFVIPLFVGHQVVQPCTCKEYIVLGYFPLSQSKH